MKESGFTRRRVVCLLAAIGFLACPSAFPTRASSAMSADTVQMRISADTTLVYLVDTVVRYARPDSSRYKGVALRTNLFYAASATPNIGLEIPVGEHLSLGFNAGIKPWPRYNLEIPMLTVAENAYKSMFDSCTNLERGPQLLPATSLGKTCYRNMFYNCANLENAPVLAATKLVQGCYQRMFYGCVKINYIKMLGTRDYYRDDCFISDGTNWCGNVAASGELWLDASLNPVTNYPTTWNKIVPEGWSVKYVGIDDQ